MESTPTIRYIWEDVINLKEVLNQIVDRLNTIEEMVREGNLGLARMETMTRPRKSNLELSGF